MAETEKPQLVQDWLDGKVRTWDAISLGLLSPDLGTALWAQELLAAQLRPPTPWAALVNVC